MLDNLTKEQRSYCMSKIRSKWTDQEKKIHNHLKSHKIKHNMHPNITGSPDILLRDIDTVLFLHGCFWHKCPKCYKEPKSNKEYWLPKIENNVKRDGKNVRLLRKQGFKVRKIWEHEVKKDLNKVVNKIICFHP
jgi:DNA mismatch endonuclease, patch repair protein